MDDRESEPGLLFPGNIGGAEFLFKDLGFFPTAQDLHGDEDDEDEQEPWFVGPDDDACDEEGTKYVDRVSYAGVKSRGYEGGGFCLHTEGAAELKAGDDEEQKGGGCDGQTNDVGGCPWHAGGLEDEQHRKDENDGESDEVQFHVRPLLSGGFANDSIVHCAG